MKALSKFPYSLFWPITFFVLILDSSWLLTYGHLGQIGANILAFSYLALLLFNSTRERRWTALLFIPLSYLGEAVFSYILGFYEYRTDHIPLYVPMGHSILLLTGLYLADQIDLSTHKSKIRAALITFHGTLIFIATILLKDTFSGLFGGIYLLTLPFYKKFISLGLVIGVLVFYIEIIGTVAGCWHWSHNPLGILHTFNPPVGAFVFYVIGKIMAIEFSAYLGTILMQNYKKRA